MSKTSIKSTYSSTRQCKTYSTWSKILRVKVIKMRTCISSKAHLHSPTLIGLSASQGTLLSTLSWLIARMWKIVRLIKPWWRSTRSRTALWIVLFKITNRAPHLRVKSVLVDQISEVCYSEMLMTTEIIYMEYLSHLNSTNVETFLLTWLALTVVIVRKHTASPQF